MKIVINIPDKKYQVIKTALYAHISQEFAQELVKYIKNGKTLKEKPKSEWIPVSEKLPNKTGYYLIQYSRKICPDEMAVAYYSVEEKESDPNYDWEFKPTCGDAKEVIAWMPLSKPYQSKDENVQKK